MRRALRTKPRRQKQAHGLTRELRHKLLAACPKDLLGLRNHALIAVGYDTLCRRAELVSLVGAAQDLMADAGFYSMETRQTPKTCRNSKDFQPLRPGCDQNPISEYQARTPPRLTVCIRCISFKPMIKLAAESWAKNFGVRVAIVRLFSVYGAHPRKQLIWEQTRKILAGDRQLTLCGTGLQTRDWVHIDDAAMLLIEAIDPASASVQIVNGCTGVATTIKDTIALLVAASSNIVEVQFSGEERPGDPALRQSSEARESLEVPLSACHN